MRICTLLALGTISGIASGESPVRLIEKTSAVGTYRVVSNSTISGELMTPETVKDKPRERIKIAGRSSIDYLEKSLPTDPTEADIKCLRVYEKIEFQKTSGDRTDESTLRLAVRRLVMMKKGIHKSPFSPDGPLLWGEIDLLRTDLIVPALAGLLASQPVQAGDTWSASPAAVAELTDLEKIE